MCAGCSVQTKRFTYDLEEEAEHKTNQETLVVLTLWHTALLLEHITLTWQSKRTL